MTTDSRLRRAIADATGRISELSATEVEEFARRNPELSCAADGGLTDAELAVRQVIRAADLAKSILDNRELAE